MVSVQTGMLYTMYLLHRFALPSFHLKCRRCKMKNHQMSLVVVVVYSLVVSSCLMLSLQPRAKLRSLNPSSQLRCQLHLHCPHLLGPRICSQISSSQISLISSSQSDIKLDHCHQCVSSGVSRCSVVVWGCCRYVVVVAALLLPDAYLIGST